MTGSDEIRKTVEIGVEIGFQKDADNQILVEAMAGRGGCIPKP